MSKNTNPTNNANPIEGSSDGKGLFSFEELFKINTHRSKLKVQTTANEKKMLQLVP
jgi:hypothetical protein